MGYPFITKSDTILLQHGAKSIQFCAGFSTSKGCRFSVTAQVAQDSLQGGAISGEWHNDY